MTQSLKSQKEPDKNPLTNHMGQTPIKIHIIGKLNSGKKCVDIAIYKWILYKQANLVSVKCGEIQCLSVQLKHVKIFMQSSLF